MFAEKTNLNEEQSENLEKLIEELRLTKCIIAMKQ
jgi:hypothetical protein